MKKVILFFAMAIIGSSLFAQTKWTADPAHTFVSFSVKHLGISFVNGAFKKFDGSYFTTKADLSDIQINFTADVNSISTGVDQRDTHLKSDAFFNAEKFPQIKFESVSFKKIKGSDYVLTGNLTMRDVTKLVTFNVVYGGVTKDPWGNMRSGFTASTSVNRFDFNVAYDPTGLTVAKQVQLTLNMEFVQGK